MDSDRKPDAPGNATMHAQIAESVALLANALTSRNLTLVAAESCTGGFLAASLTESEGSSQWFEGAFVTYRLTAKQTFLGVDPKILDRWGAVSEPTARAMAEGALQHSTADLSVAITGIAGPGGGDPSTPTGTVWFAWAARAEELTHAACYRFSGDRSAVRELAVAKAIWGLLKLSDPAQREDLTRRA